MNASIFTRFNRRPKTERRYLVHGRWVRAAPDQEAARVLAWFKSARNCPSPIKLSRTVDWPPLPEQIEANRRDRLEGTAPWKQVSFMPGLWQE